VNITDINVKDGPYWAAYQEKRRKDGIFENPDYVPTWFLIRLAHARISAARTTLEQLGERQGVGVALWKLERLFADASLDVREQVALAILGADEVPEEVWS
jgi:hypothetical protein